MSSAAAIVVPAVKRHTATIIVAHGLGDSGAGWSWLSDTWRRQKKFEEVSFIFPNAPVIPITVNGGMRMPGWYDIQDFGDLANRSEDEEGILRSRATLQGLIQGQLDKGIPSERIVLGGFSQGSAMSLLTGLTGPHKLGGVFGLSGYMLLAKKFQGMIPASNPNKDTKVFMGHGEQDPLVKFAWGQMTANKLKEFGFDVEFKSYAQVGPYIVALRRPLTCSQRPRPCGQSRGDRGPRAVSQRRPAGLGRQSGLIHMTSRPAKRHCSSSSHRPRHQRHGGPWPSYAVPAVPAELSDLDRAAGFWETHHFYEADESFRSQCKKADFWDRVS